MNGATAFTLKHAQLTNEPGTILQKTNIKCMELKVHTEIFSSLY